MKTKIAYIPANIIVVLLGLLLVCISSVEAGGFHLFNGQINGLDSPVTVKQRATTELCFNAYDYLFSGHGNQYSYVMFTISRDLKLGKSVGRDGVNQAKDVKTIQTALRDIDIYRGEITGQMDDELIRAIERFQKDYAQQKVDGRIDARGKTVKVLNLENSEAYFVKLRRRKASGVTGHSDHQIKDCVYFQAPARAGVYDIKYSRAPFLVDYQIGQVINKDGKDITVLDIKDQRFVKRVLLRDVYSVIPAATIKVAVEGPRDTTGIATYLRVNDKIPGVQNTIASGHFPNPVKISWHTKPKNKPVRFRYRLYPDQVDYSYWSDRQTIDYFFIGSGSHTFEVQTQYQKDDGQWAMLPVSDYSFFLEKPFISKPVIYKASGGVTHSPALPDLANLYAGSKALLIGVDEYEKFQFLPYVTQDIKRMKDTLSQHGFDVTTVVGKKTRDDILNAIEDFLASLKPNERIIIYFSSHGFQDKIVKTKGYIATYNCDPARPGVNCIELGDLENRMQRAIQKPVQHLLVVLDSCSSGLGVISKSPEYKELAIAAEAGAHMITAGMIEQEAEMDNVEMISTFTRYLAEGLDGKADYTQDNVISLTELLLYVRYEVATKTKGAQTPMIGRLEGSGEMIFQINTQ